MEGFINKQYYVECHSKEEINEFMQICEDANLRLRSGLLPKSYPLSANVVGAVFAYNWRGEHDGISCWHHYANETVYRSDHLRPHIPFEEIAAHQNNYDVSGVLDLL